MAALTYALPSVEERRECATARVAFWAYMITEHRRMGMVAMLGSPCNACGHSTNNWCDTCEGLGFTFVGYHGQVLHGSPLCNACDNDWHCYVCGAGMPANA